MGSNDVLPVGRFSPARGITVTRSGKSAAIDGAMELFGPAATASVATTIEASINSIWTATFPDGYSVTCKIKVRFRGAGSTATDVTQIEAVAIDGPSHVGIGTRGRYMVLNAKERDAFTWTAAHEFGHIIGLADRYSESIMSKIGGLFGGQRTTTVDTGYSGNLMAVSGGALWSRNLADLAVENEPSPCWINDDDYVSEWVNTSPLSDVTRLPTSSKLKALNTLLGGSACSDDLRAMTKICSSVKTKKGNRSLGGQ